MIQLWRDAPPQFDSGAVCHLDGEKQPGATTRPTTARARSSSARCGARPATASYGAYVWRMQSAVFSSYAFCPSSFARPLCWLFKFWSSLLRSEGIITRMLRTATATGRRVLVSFFVRTPPRAIPPRPTLGMETSFQFDDRPPCYISPTHNLSPLG